MASYTVKAVWVGQWWQYMVRANDGPQVPYRSKGYRTQREAQSAGRRALKRYLDNLPPARIA